MCARIYIRIHAIMIALHVGVWYVSDWASLWWCRIEKRSCRGHVWVQHTLRANNACARAQLAYNDLLLRVSESPVCVFFFSRTACTFGSIFCSSIHQSREIIRFRFANWKPMGRSRPIGRVCTWFAALFSEIVISDVLWMGVCKRGICIWGTGFGRNDAKFSLLLIL